MKMRNLLPAALAVALTVVAGFYFLRSNTGVREDAAPRVTGSIVE